MPDILRVTLPPTGQENINKLRPNINQPQPSITTVVDPTRVTGTNNQTVQKDRQQEQFAKAFESNFDKFMQSLRGMNVLSDSYNELVFSKLYSIVNSGISEDFTEEISKFLELLKLDSSELLAFIKGQAQTNSKFSGEFFDILRELINSKPSNDLKQNILEFLKTYDAFTGNNHLLKTILSNLNNIKNSIPRQYATSLEQLISKLNTTHSNGSSVANLNVLKTEIFPFLSNYVGNTKDFSSTRDLINILTLNLVKYESGTKINLEMALKKLISNPNVASKLANFSEADINNILTNDKYNHANTKLMDSLSSLISNGLNGEAGPQTKEVFENILNALLLNKSVYMPVSHMIIPANVDGNMFFSEIWVDPNDTSDGEHDPKNPATKLLIKFDIKDVGFFELIILCKDKKVDMQLYYPDKYSEKNADMRNSINKIMEKNGLLFNYFGLDKCDTPVALNEVFPKIYEKKDTINVTI